MSTEGNEFSEILSDVYCSTNFNWFTDPLKVDKFEMTAIADFKYLPNGDQSID